MRVPVSVAEKKLKAVELKLQEQFPTCSVTFRPEVLGRVAEKDGSWSQYDVLLPTTDVKTVYSAQAKMPSMVREVFGYWAKAGLELPLVSIHWGETANSAGNPSESLGVESPLTDAARVLAHP